MQKANACEDTHVPANNGTIYFNQNHIYPTQKNQMH